MTSFDHAWSLASTIPGWLSREQAAVLYTSVERLTAGSTVVEIGSFRGRSTVVLALAATDGVEVVAIDPHAGNDRGPRELDGYDREAAADRRAFRESLAMAGVDGRVRHLDSFSHEALGLVEGSIDVVFVDGAHRFGAARRDLRAWGRRLAPGGTLLVHDAFSSIGVTLAIIAELLTARHVGYERRVRSLAIYRADRPGSSMASAARQLAQLGWFVRNLALKALIATGVLGDREWPY